MKRGSNPAGAMATSQTGLPTGKEGGPSQRGTGKLGSKGKAESSQDNLGVQSPNLLRKKFVAK